MKTQILIFAAIIFSLISCQNQGDKQSKNSTRSDTEETQDVKPAKKIIKLAVEYNYLIAEGQVGHIKVQTDEIMLNPSEHHIHETRPMDEEGVKYEAEIDHILNQNNDTLISIDDYGFWIFSPEYQTEAKIHVNKTMADFFGEYADAKIYYSYVSGIFWMTSESIKDVEFAIENSSYQGEDDLLMQSDLVEIEPQYMNESAKITKIRVY